MLTDIAKQILAFYDRLARDANHRYRSWEHCYQHFRRHGAFTTVDDIDTASLHLAFYLASWGMYRGSSALLWKDYRIHRPAVTTLFEQRYVSLWDLDSRDDARDSQTAALICSLSGALRCVYHRQITEVDSKPREFQASDTLITKLMLGTLGCTPACDRYFILGWRHAGLPYSRFGKSFLSVTLRFYREHTGEFHAARDAIAQLGGGCYPPMKLVDMYFWETGFNLVPEAVDDVADVV